MGDEVGATGVTADADPATARAAALTHATALVGDRWTLLVVDTLLAGPARYSELEERVDGISPSVLSSRLRQLEDAGLVVAEPYQQRPVRHDYRLTDRGRSLAAVLDLLAAWGDNEVEAPTHAVCGTPVAVAHWCPTCEQPVEVDEQPMTM